MVITQGRGKTLPSGKRLFKLYRTKRKYEIGREPAATKLGERKVKIIRTKSGHQKQRMKSANIVNLYNPKTKKHSMVKVKTITDNAANRHFVRRNIFTQGAIVDT